MSKPAKIPTALLLVYNQFLKFKKFDIEYFGSINYPIICVGDATSCPPDATNWLANNSKNNMFWHSHPWTRKRCKEHLREIEYISPADILFFLNYHSKKTYLFALNCVYEFTFPKSLKYSVIRDMIDELLEIEENKKENRHKKTIWFPMSNKAFCDKLGIKRTVFITKTQAIKEWKKQKHKCCHSDED